MNFIKCVAALSMSLALVACGGGGGSPGGATTTDIPNSPIVTSPVVTVGSMSLDVLSGAGISSTSISASEIAQVKVVLKDANGTAVKGAVVTFSETGAGLLAIAPTSKTALTGEAGEASVEIRATNNTSIGATQIGASATLSGQSVSAQKSIAITSAPTSSVVVSPQELANAINFLDVNPSDKSIVLAGSGGNGRSESASLRFRVVDKNNTPVKGVAVTFSVIPANDVTLNIPSALSDTDGVVITTVSSKNVATAVVVKALVDTKTISTQSDQLLVTTGVVTQAGFDLSATKYNLNFGTTGDSSEITVAIVDENGNRVADGVPVVFTTNYGAVGTSSKGGCTTLNGSCKVTYTVQDPRPTDGERARVTASTQVGAGFSVSDFLDLTISDPSLLNLYSMASGGVTINSVNSSGLPNPCKFTYLAYVGTPAGLPAPAGTTISVKSLTTDFVASVTTGSPVLDLEQQRTSVAIEFDASSAALTPQCVSNGTGSATGQVEIKFTAGSRITTLAPLVITYPRTP